LTFFILGSSHKENFEIMSRHHTSRFYSTLTQALFVRALRCSVSSVLVLSLLAAGCFAVAPLGRAQASVLRSPLGGPQFSYTEGHVYLNEPTGAVDVTSTMYTSNGNTYVVYNSTTIQIVCSYTEGHVYDMSGKVIGFIATSATPR
jgi:hypothetical protein